MRATAWRFVAASAAVAGLMVACGARTGLLVPDPEPIDSGPDVIKRKDAGRDVNVEDVLPPIDATKLDANKTDCPDADGTLVYAVTIADELLSFYPPDSSFKLIGHLACPAPPSYHPFSMAVDRKGSAYILYSNQANQTLGGPIFKVSTANASCQATSYVPNQGPFTLFGMGFATVGAGPAEQLFIATNDGVLGTIDTQTFAVSNVGPITPTINDTELTGTGDGRLFGFYRPANASTESAVAEIDKKTAQLLGADPLPTVNQGTGWAFAFWGGVFYLFTTPAPSGQSTYRFDPVTKNVVLVAQYTSSIVGAGVSTCAPQ